MANPTKGDSLLADATGDPLLSDRQANVADTASATAASIVITYTTDDPTITTNAAITIADGDLYPAAEGIEALEEVVAQLTATNVDVAAVRTTVLAILDVLEAHGLMTET